MKDVINQDVEFKDGVVVFLSIGQEVQIRIMCDTLTVPKMFWTKVVYRGDNMFRVKYTDMPVAANSVLSKDFKIK